MSVHWVELCSVTYDSPALIGTLLCLSVSRCKKKKNLGTSHEDPGWEYSYSSTLSLTSALDGVGRSTPHPVRFIPRMKPGAHFIRD